MQFFPPAAPLPRVRAQRGVSAVELVLGVAALAAAATAGMHSLARISADVSVRDQAAALQSALNFARNEAIRLHASVDVVPVDEDWSRGWTIQVRESEAVIRRDGPLAR
ncbi:MAG: GspH/FimT family protein, partial [Rhodocyclaceae bacterium]|nr:GspH/FimT family protein [Rhodocyclaceae bacterium]